MMSVLDRPSAVGDVLFAPRFNVNVSSLAAPYESVATELILPQAYCPHIPDPIKDAQQYQFVNDDRKELLYGGAAGGGKSDAILMSALKYVEVPGYAALLLRRTFRDLNQPDSLIPRSKEWLRHTDAKWDGNSTRWTFPSGATLTFGYMARDDDVYQYQSAAYQFVGYDELTQFSELQYTYLFSRMRRKQGSTIPIRMRGATNPGGIGHRWVKDRFVDQPATDDRAFIPSKLSDNRHVDREQYREELKELDEHTRKQLEEGDWTARLPGAWVLDHQGLDKAFELGDLLDHGKLPPPVGGALHLGMDFGESNHILIGWPLEHNGMFIAHEYTYSRGEPDTQAKEFYDRVFSLGRYAQYALARQRFDSSKPESMRLWLRGAREVGMANQDANRGKPAPIAFNKFKRFTILHMRKMLENGIGGRLGYLAISGENCPVLKEQLYEWQFKNDDTEDVKKENDHGPDAMVSLLAPHSLRKAN